MNKIINKTPLQYNKRLSRIYNCNIYLIREIFKLTWVWFYFCYISDCYILVYWSFIKRLKPQNQLKVTEFLTKIFFPVHWYFKDSWLVQFLLRRISPIAFYYCIFDLTKQQHYEFSRLDTHDKNTDHYKRHLTERGLDKVITRYNFQKYEIRCL